MGKATGTSGEVAVRKAGTWGEEPARNTTGTSWRSLCEERDRYFREKPRGTRQVLTVRAAPRNVTGTSRRSREEHGRYFREKNP